MKKKEFVSYQLHKSLEVLSAGIAIGCIGCSFLKKIRFNFDIYYLIGSIFMIISILIMIMIHNNYEKKFAKLIDLLNND
jgi:hypothetical protein